MKKALSLISFLVLNLIMYSQSINWVKNMEGLRNCEGYSIALDASGNVYTTGYFDSIMDFDPGPGTYSLASQGRRDIFISKFDGSGHFMWAKSIGSGSDDAGYAIKIDGLNNVLVTGSFTWNVDFDPGIGINILNSTAQDMFVLKLDNNGNFIWARNMGGTDWVEGRSLSLDLSGNISLTGRFMGTVDFDPGVNTYNLSNINAYGHSDFFISKLDASGNFLWAHRYGNYGWYEATCVTNDVSGNLYMTGSYYGSVDFDAGPGTQILISPSHSNTYFLKLDAGGNFLWVKEFADSSSHSYGNSIILDNLGNIYSTGSFTGSKDFDPGIGTFTMTAPFSEDSYLMKLDNSGNFIWARQMSGGMSKGYGISLDLYGNIITTGVYDGFSDIDSGPSVFTMSVALGSPEMYFMKTNPVNGNVLAAKVFGAGYWCHGTSIVTDGSNNIYATGFFEGTGTIVDFDPGPATFTLNTTDRNTNFILKLSDINTSFEELNINEGLINIFPNPNNGTFNIVSKNKMNLSLINNLGQIIETIELNEANTYQQNIQINTSGIYYINGVTEQSSIKQKIIVTK